MENNNGMNKEERVAVLTTNPKLIYNNYTLIKNENVLEALESYEKHKLQNSNPTSAFVKARIKNLYRHLRQDLKKNLKLEEFNQAEYDIKLNDYDKILILYEDTICGFLAEVGLISTAKAREYDTQDPLAEDDAKGF